MKNSNIKKDDLLSKLSIAIKEKGFSAAWNENLKEVVKLYHNENRDPSKTIVGQDLFALMQLSPEIKKHFDSLPKGILEEIEASFLPENKTPKWDSLLHNDFIDGLKDLFVKNVKDFNEAKEADGSSVKVLENEVFQNWGRTVENIPKYTFFPESKFGVQNIVKYAKANQLKVRVAGYRHTWGDLYSADDQILISTLSLEVATGLPAIHPPINPLDDLQGINIIGTIIEDGETKGLCKIGAATTNEQFRQWATGENGTTPGGWTVPLNVIMVEITWGGSNAPICHGAGLRHKTLSDLVYEIEYVDPNGELQTVKDKAHLKAAAGCFGLLGVVTAVTLKLDKITYANMRPYKQRIGLTIPPPTGFQVPKGIDMSGITPEDSKAAWQKFTEQAENKYYSEWFWFAFQKDCWINCWNNDGDAAKSKPYPTEEDTHIQEAQEYLAQLITESSFFKWLSAETQATIMAGGAMTFLPDITGDVPSIVTPLIDGLHFRRGIQNLRVFDMEWEIPIPAKADDPSKPDWSVCQKAWWDVIKIFYDRYNSNSSDVPMRLTMEMRIMGGSDIIMAPQQGNNFGTCSIEVLTILTTTKKDWQNFLQEITTAWASYTDASGNLLNIRPHWAKEWAGLKLRGMDINDYLKKDAYKDQLPTFKKVLKLIANEQGFTLADMKQRFSNPLLDNIFEEVFKSDPV